MQKEKHAKLLHYKDYVAGWLDSSIHDFLEAFPSTSRTAFALITCLDSDPDPKSLLAKSSDLRDAMKDVKPLGKGLLLRSTRLQDASLRRLLFFGFDEIWFFPGDKIEPKPDAASIVGPKRIDQVKLDLLGPWMAETGCSLALGDGAGLNVIVKARGLVRRLIGYSIFQPEPAETMNGFVREDTGEE